MQSKEKRKVASKLFAHSMQKQDLSKCNATSNNIEILHLKELLSREIDSMIERDKEIVFKTKRLDLKDKIKVLKIQNDILEWQ